jgi:hypothetical protein
MCFETRVVGTYADFILIVQNKYTNDLDCFRKQIFLS